MKETIDSVIKMNEKAKKIIEGAKEEAADIISNANFKAEAILLESRKNAEERADEAAKNIEHRISAEADNVAFSTNKSQTEFAELFETKEETWIETIYNNIISGAQNV